MVVYHPNLYARQLRFRQAIPIPFFDSVQCGTSYRLHSPPEVTFRAARRNLEVMSKVSRKPMALNFECTSNFASWWEVRWTEKYGGDLHEAHNCIFQQLSIKSYLKPTELEDWKEMIHQKNQLLLLGISYSFNLKFL
ncbi:hypothetical protein ACFX14_003686 [Malus domestica]